MKKISLFLLGLIFLLGCRKDDVVVCLTPETGPNTLASLLAAGPPVRKLPFDLGQAQRIPTIGGGTVAFGANAFVLPNGSVATGQAELWVREIYSVADMILADMPTTAQSSRQMLVSGGEFNIQVWQGSTRLRMARVSPTGTINRLTLTSPVPRAGLDTTPMLLWTQPAATGIRADSAGWLQADTTSQVFVVASPITTAAYYRSTIALDSISNWNIDQFWHAYQGNSLGYIGVEVPAGATATRVYFRPVGFNGLARSYPVYGSTTRRESYLPLGADVIAVVLQEQNGQLYFGTQRLTTAANAVVTPTLQALSAADIVQRIRQL